jgi:hypothetical protein
MKTFLTSIIFCISASVAFAQQGLEFGPDFQVQTTWLINQDDMDKGPDLDYKNTMQIAYGFTTSYGFAPRHGIRTGIYFSQQGQNYITSEEFLELPKAQYKILTEYIQVPLLYRYNGSLSIANTAFLLTVGPQFGFLQSASGTYLQRKDTTATPKILAESIQPIKDAKSLYNTMDISAHLGLGLTARFSKKWHMNALLNFNYSFQDIEKVKMPLTRRPTRNAVVGIGVSFYYLIGGPEMAGPPKMR